MLTGIFSELGFWCKPGLLITVVENNGLVVNGVDKHGLVTKITGNIQAVGRGGESVKR